jgi:hypothetical protein
VFVAVAMTALLLFMTGLSRADRLRHAAIYAVLVLACAAPYLAFLQWNGGVVPYLRQASAWAERDRAREPVVWPGLFDNPDGVSDDARHATGIRRAAAIVRDNRVAWLFYFEIALPFLALAMLRLSESGFRPAWPQARAKLAMTAVLAAALDAGFLRSPLEGRLADTSVPLAVLVAWLLVAVPALVVRPRLWQAAPGPRRWAIAGVAVGVWLCAVLMLATVVTGDFRQRLEKAYMTSSLDETLERTERVTVQLRQDWDLSGWMARPERSELITLSAFVNACTAPTDRVLVSLYLPQVLALARRGFAGGHADLRPGFFEDEPAQRLTVERLRRQSVPLILLDSGEALDTFRESYPILSAYIDRTYRPAATHVFDGRFGLTLFTRRDLTPASVWEPLGWPCFAPSRR